MLCNINIEDNCEDSSYNKCENASSSEDEDDSYDEVESDFSDESEDDSSNEHENESSDDAALSVYSVDDYIFDIVIIYTTSRALYLPCILRCEKYLRNCFLEGIHANNFVHISFSFIDIVNIH